MNSPSTQVHATLRDRPHRRAGGDKFRCLAPHPPIGAPVPSPSPRTARDVRTLPPLNPVHPAPTGRSPPLLQQAPLHNTMRHDSRDSTRSAKKLARGPRFSPLTCANTCPARSPARRSVDPCPRCSFAQFDDKPQVRAGSVWSLVQLRGVPLRCVLPRICHLPEKYIRIYDLGI